MYRHTTWYMFIGLHEATLVALFHISLECWFNYRMCSQYQVLILSTDCFKIAITYQTPVTIVFDCHSKGSNWAIIIFQL